MRRRLEKIRLILSLIVRGKWQIAWQQVKSRIHETSVAYGLYRDLNDPFTASSAKIPITVRPLEARDVPKIFDLDSPETTELWTEYNFYETGIPTCYVAVTEDDEPCYMQWLIGSEHNDAMQDYFHGLFPVLAPNEALLENAHTLEAFRGLHIMSAAMAQIAEHGPDKGANRILTFVEHDNIASLKGCRRAGFEPYVVRELQRRFFFFRRIIFRDLSAGPPYPLEPKH